MPDNRTTTPTKQRPPVWSGTAWGRAGLDGELLFIECAVTGTRHGQLWKSSASVGEIIAGGELSETHAYGRLMQAGRNIGLSESDVRRQVDRGLERGKQNPRKAPTDQPMLRNAGDAREEVIAWLESISANPPTGRTSGTVQAILQGVGKIALQAGCVRLDLSYRQISEASGVSLGTVSTRKAEWLRYMRIVKKGSRRNRTRTTVQLVTKGCANLNSSEAFPSGKGLLFNPAHPLSAPAENAWHGAKGKWKVWVVVCSLNGSANAQEIALQAGMHKSSVRGILYNLRDAGLVATDGEGNYEYGHPTEEQIEQFSATATDFAQDRADRHARDRELDRLREAHEISEQERHKEMSVAPANVDLETGEILATVATMPNVTRAAPDRGQLFADDAFLEPSSSCSECDKSMTGTRRRQTCSDACRKRRSRRIETPTPELADNLAATLENELQDGLLEVVA